MLQHSKNIILWALTCFIFNSAFSQNYVYVYFKDKSCNNHLMSTPSKFLSTKALERRVKQNIDIKQNDLPICQSYLDVLKKHDVNIVKKSKWLNLVLISNYNATLFQQFDFVKKVEPVRKYKSDLKAEEAKNNTSRYNYQYSETQIEVNGGICLHENGFTGEGMTIAVMDGGFTNSDELECFKHLFDSGKILGTFDFVDGDEYVYEGSGHGTNVFSLMASYLPDRFIGTAPFANYWLFRTENTASETLQEEINWIAAAEFADSVGVDVINTSLGYTTFDVESENHSYKDMDGNTTPISIAADIAASKGIFVVNSAGNSGNGNWRYISAPADGDSVVAIAAVDSLGIKASFSSVGPSSDGQIKPDFAAVGSNNNYFTTSGNIAIGSGTSFSAPLFTGMATCLWQAYPKLNNMELYQIIKESADNQNNPDSLLGYGIPNFCQAYFKQNYNSKYDENLYFEVDQNPISEDFMVFFNFDKIIEDLSLQITDLSGRILFKQSVDCNLQQLVIRENIIGNYLGNMLLFSLKSNDRYLQHQKVFKLN